MSDNKSIFGLPGLICSHLCTMLFFEKHMRFLVPKDVPFRPSMITSAFLETALKNSKILSEEQRVTDVQAKLFGVGAGFFSQMYRLNITYSPSGCGPATIVAKLSPKAPKTRLAGSLLSLFKYEYEFYSQDVGPKIGLRVPRCYFSGYGHYGRVCILMEDFSPARTPDQLESLSTSNVKEVLTQISKLHAKVTLFFPHGNKYYSLTLSSFE